MNQGARATRSWMASGFVAAAVGAAVVFSAAAHDGHEDESQPIAPFGEVIAHHVDSGFVANNAPFAATVASDVIVTPDALWTRFYFREILLEGDSRIRFTSLLDGQVQELRAADAAMWGNTSAYFNGGMVKIELIAAPGTTRNRYVLDSLGVEFGVVAASNHCTPPLQCGLCNGDTRVPSNENWACRLVSAGGGCSAAIYNTQSCVVSAGHCMGSNMVIQFNVPSTSPNCSINHPPVLDQFPITSQISQNSGAGADWAVMTSGVNGLGQTAFDRFGEYRPIASTVPSSGPADVWGYGVTDSCVLSQTQQHSSGVIFNVAGSAIYHSADTTCGNSGSSLLSNGQIIGIVSHCSYSCPPDGNTATRIDVPAFVAARNNICSPLPEDVHVPGDFETIQAAIDAVGGGSTIRVGPGTYHEAISFVGKSITVISSGGPAVTTIDASGKNASVVRFSNGEGSSAVLEGFTLTGGTGSQVNLGGTGYVLGGGIYAANGATPTINDCVITGNSAEFGGGVFNNNASPTFNNCRIRMNTASPSSGGGVFNFSGAAPKFNAVEFVSNGAASSGGGMSSQDSDPVVNNCVFVDNTAAADGGAVRNIQGAAGQFVNCHFGGNSAGGTGGAFFNDASPSTYISGSTFCGNSPNHVVGSYNNGGGNAYLPECPSPCDKGDLNCDGVVDITDLLLVLSHWGQCEDVSDCPADVDGNGIVDISDLMGVLSLWG